MSDVPSIIFFSQFLEIFFANIVSIYFSKFIFSKFTKIKILSSLSLYEIINKKNAWNIRHLVDESFVPANQGTSILYCILSDFWAIVKNRNGLLTAVQI